MTNDWFLESSTKESILIEEELVSINQLKNLSEYENHPLLEKKQKIMMQTIKKEDLNGILIGLLFSFNFREDDKIIESIEDIMNLDDLIPNDIHTILCFSELLLSSSKLSTKEVISFFHMIILKKLNKIEGKTITKQSKECSPRRFISEENKYS